MKKFLFLLLTAALSLTASAQVKQATIFQWQEQPAQHNPPANTIYMYFDKSGTFTCLDHTGANKCTGGGGGGTVPTTTGGVQGKTVVGLSASALANSNMSLDVSQFSGDICHALHSAIVAGQANTPVIGTMDLRGYGGVQACNEDPFGDAIAGTSYQNVRVRLLFNPGGVDIVTSVPWFTPQVGIETDGAAANSIGQNGVLIEGCGPLASAAAGYSAGSCVSGTVPRFVASTIHQPVTFNFAHSYFPAGVYSGVLNLGGMGTSEGEGWNHDGASITVQGIALSGGGNPNVFGCYTQNLDERSLIRNIRFGGAPSGNADHTTDPYGAGCFVDRAEAATNQAGNGPARSVFSNVQLAGTPSGGSLTNTHWWGIVVYGSSVTVTNATLGSCASTPIAWATVNSSGSVSAVTIDPKNNGGSGCSNPTFTINGAPTTFGGTPNTSATVTPIVGGGVVTGFNAVGGTNTGYTVSYVTGGIDVNNFDCAGASASVKIQGCVVEDGVVNPTTSMIHAINLNDYEQTIGHFTPVASGTIAGWDGSTVAGGVHLGSASQSIHVGHGYTSAGNEFLDDASSQTIDVATYGSTLAGYEQQGWTITSLGRAISCAGSGCTPNVPALNLANTFTAANSFKDVTINQNANGDDALLILRQTDSGPTGNFINLKNHASAASVFSIDVLGNANALTYTTTGTTNGLVSFGSTSGGGDPSFPAASAILIAPNSSIATSYGWRFPTAENGSAGLLHFGAASSHISAMTISPVVTGDITSLQEDKLTGSTAATSVTETGVGFAITRIGVETANLTAPYVFRNNNSANSNTSITLGITAPGTSAGQTVLNVNGAATGGDFTDWGTGGAWAAGVLSGQTIVASVGIGGAFISKGTTAGFIDFPQGSSSLAVTPCNVATSICEQAPTSVTSYTITKPGAAPNIASIKVTDGCGSSNCTEVFKVAPIVLSVASDFTTANNTNLQTITGLSWTAPASKAITVAFHCSYVWSQATGTAAVAFGIQGATTAPTNLAANATSFSNTTAETTGTLAALASTTATAVVSVAPSAITTKWKAEMDGSADLPSNASPTVLNFMVSTATGADAVTIARNSYCKLDVQ